MTSLHLDPNAPALQIRAYRPGYLQLNEKILTHSLILTPNELIENWPPQTLSDLTVNDLLPALKIKPDLLLLGTGAELVFPPTELYGHLINQGISVEIMSTRAACHTYTILAAEGRNIAAALIIL